MFVSRMVNFTLRIQRMGSLDHIFSKRLHFCTRSILPLLHINVMYRRDGRIVGETPPMIPIGKTFICLTTLPPPYFYSDRCFSRFHGIHEALVGWVLIKVENYPLLRGQSINGNSRSNFGRNRRRLKSAPWNSTAIEMGWMAADGVTESPEERRNRVAIRCGSR